MLRFQVSVSKGDEPPKDGKGQPTEDETGCENQHCPSPLNIHLSSSNEKFNILIEMKHYRAIDG